MDNELAIYYYANLSFQTRSMFSGASTRKCLRADVEVRVCLWRGVLQIVWESEVAGEKCPNRVNLALFFFTHSSAVWDSASAKLFLSMMHYILNKSQVQWDMLITCKYQNGIVWIHEVVWLSVKGNNKVLTDGPYKPSARPQSSLVPLPTPRASTVQSLFLLRVIISN